MMHTPMSTTRILWPKALQLAFIVVLVWACSLSVRTVRCDIPIGSTINMLPLSLDAATVAKLSNSPNQQEWWHLTDEDWHDSAIERFFSAGPLNTNQMDNLAAQSGKTDAWKLSGINIGNIGNIDLRQRLQSAATTEYKMSKSVPGTGDIQASMWTLMFHFESSNCTGGYMVPIAVVPTVNGDDGKTVFAYATVWQNPTDMVLINAIPASFNIQPEKIPIDPLYSSVLPVCNIQHLPKCPPAGAYAFRTLLDSAYGLAPAVSCVGFAGEDESFTIVVTGMTGSPFSASEVRPVHLQQCSEAPLMTKQGSISTICSHGRCIALKDMDPTSALPARLSYIKSMLSILENCTVISVIDNTTVNCGGFNISLLTPNSASNTLSVESKWVSTQGSDTLDFQYAPQYNAANVCYALLDTGSPSTNVTPPVEIMIQALDYLTSYITVHNAAFTTEKGPATDPYTFYALIVSTALSVVTIAVPFTDFMLRALCRVHPFYLNSRSKAMKIILQVWCNVVLGLAFLLPVLSLAKNELDRQHAFSTWALASEDLVYDKITSSGPVRVVYFFSATSQYSSHFLSIISLVICLTCIPVAASTARRCLQVFKRYGLLCKDSEGQTVSSASLSALMKAMKAIEMGRAEYMDLLSRVEAHGSELCFTEDHVDHTRHRTWSSSKF